MRARIGPGVLVAAAFVGPGTVTAATLAGAEYGYVLGWGITLSIVATIVLQEAAARLGVGGGLGLGEALRRRVPGGLPFGAVASLVVAAIFVGNAAYEGGNLRGALLGADLLLGGGGRFDIVGVLVVAACAAGLLWTGRFALIQGALAATVACLAVAYLVAAAAGDIDWAAAARGLLPLRLPAGSEWSIVALIGTTVVPYNLFLHAAAAREHYGAGGDLSAARRDTYASVVLGGVVTLAISLLAASSIHAAGLPRPEGAVALAEPLAQVLGQGGHLVVGVGLLAAGVSSAITAPLAGAYAVGGLFGWSGLGLRSGRSRIVWGAVLATGLLAALVDVKPLALITLAQVANGLLLPVLAGFLLWTVNDRQLLGRHANGPVANALGGLVVLIALLLGARMLIGAVS